MLFALVYQRGVHLQQQRQAQFALGHEAGQQEQVVAFVDDVGPELARGGHELAVGHHAVAQFHELVERARQHGLEAVHPAHIVAHAAFVAADRGGDDAHLVAQAAQGLDHFLDVHGLAVLAGGAVVVEDAHGASGDQAICRRGAASRANSAA